MPRPSISRTKKSTKKRVPARIPERDTEADDLLDTEEAQESDDGLSEIPVALDNIAAKLMDNHTATNALAEIISGFHTSFDARLAELTGVINRGFHESAEMLALIRESLAQKATTAPPPAPTPEPAPLPVAAKKPEAEPPAEVPPVPARREPARKAAPTPAAPPPAPTPPSAPLLEMDGVPSPEALREKAKVALLDYAKKHGRDKLVALFGQFGASRLPEVPDQKLGALILAAQKGE